MVFGLTVSRFALPFFMPAHILGQVDSLNDRIIRGWAWSLREKRRRLVLDVFYKEIFLGQAFAGSYRKDLELTGIGDGRHAFIFHLPKDVLGFDVADFKVATAGPERFTVQLSAALSPVIRKSPRLPTGHRLFFTPYLSTLRHCHDETCQVKKMGDRPRIDVLLLTDPGIGLSAFIVHIGHKYRQAVNPKTRLALLEWYLQVYATECGPRRAPLSRDDIFLLNETRLSPCSLAMDIVEKEIGRADSSVVFRWANEASNRLYVEDCLVTDDQVAALRAPACGHEQVPYPLSDFMLQIRRETAVLLRFRPDRTEDRQAIYVLFLIISLRRPAILAYLPQAWLDRLLANEADLASILARLFKTQDRSTAGTLRARVNETGFDIARGRWSPNIYKGHRILGGAAVVVGPPEVDVQVIGPFQSKMGLGESSRRVARAIAATPFSYNLVDYSIGSAGTNLETGLTFGPPRPARLNIMHLNLEEVPEALAFLPDVFLDAPLAVIPYWELDRPAVIHNLGLAVVDELWVASTFLTEVFAKSGVPVRWIGMSCDATSAPGEVQRGALRARYGLMASTFVFLTMSDALSWVQRKNPLGAIQAFQAAFTAAEDVALVIKTHNLKGPLTSEQMRYWIEVRSLCDQDHRIIFIDTSFDPTTQRTLLAAADCLVTLHRAEGLGLDAIDALWLGTPVVATAYSGVTDLCTPQTAWMVEAARVAVGPLDYAFVEPGHVWAAPSHTAAVIALRGVFADPDARRRKVEAAHRLVADVATTDAFARRLEDRIRHWLKRC